MKEIVGAKIGDIITNDYEIILSAIKNKEKVRLLKREEMQFMASCDPGKNWEKMASGPTLFALNN
jgi:hypothetical protein